MNMEKTTERYPIRYYSMITVAKDFISQANGSLAEGTADWKAADKELEKLKKLSEKHDCYATVVNSLTPYIYFFCWKRKKESPTGSIWKWRAPSTCSISLMKKAGWKQKRSFMKTAGTCTG